MPIHLKPIKQVAGRRVVVFCLTLFSVCLDLTLSGQTQIMPLAHQVTEASAPSCRPYLSDSLLLYSDIRQKTSSKLLRVLFFGNFIQYKDTGGINFSIHPFLNLEYGKQHGNPLYADSTYHTNGRGFLIHGNIGAKLTFFSSFIESQSKYLPYVSDQVLRTSSSVGNGRAKAFKGNGFDYAMATGHIVYRPINNLQLWFGNGKNFIGNGYRSLFLSDNSANYPFGKLVYTYRNKIQYQVLFASLSTGTRYTRYSTVEPQFITKGYTALFASWKLSPKLEIGIFESTIWNRSDYGRQRPSMAIQFNPIIGVNSLCQGLNGSNNSSLGLNFFLKPGYQITLYSQLLLDDAKKTGFQIGATKSNLFGQHLSLRGEFNMISKGTYNANDSISNYTNFLQPLAHPMGSGFTEIVGVLKYRWKRVLANIQASTAHFPDGYNGPGLIGPNQSERVKGNSKLMLVNPSVGFIINSTSNLQFNVGTLYRILQTPNFTDKTSYLYIRLSTNITNLYFDF